MTKTLIFEHTQNPRDQYPAFLMVNQDEQGNVFFTSRSPQRPPDAHWNLPTAVENVAGNSGCVTVPKHMINHLIVALHSKVYL